MIVPVYNEQFLVEASLARLRVLSDSPLLESVRIIVVDDGSSDATPQALDRFRAWLLSQEPDPKISWVWLRHKKNSGKGAAIRTGLTHVDTELVVIHDADLEYHPRDLLKMVEVFLYEDADAVFGSRFMAGGYKRALFFRHALGNKFLTFLCDLVCDLNLTDMETCYKMVRPTCSRAFRSRAPRSTSSRNWPSSSPSAAPDLRSADQLFGPDIRRRQEDRHGRTACAPSGRSFAMRCRDESTPRTSTAARFSSG